ncbi:MAG TPA: chemotaxis protein CheD [Cytophagaceae bacterium]|nr:chemotaxis protein CheD [Cytophagaceae bacterium]
MNPNQAMRSSFITAKNSESAPMPEYEKYYLHPCGLFMDKRPHQVTTILGTCVAVCLWDQQLKIGGINHYMLPLWNGEGLASPKYGNIAIEKLLHKMEHAGSQRKNIVAKIFGGKEENNPNGNNYFQIGERNAEIALGILAEEKIKIIAQSLGGFSGRKLQFFTDTGEVYMNFLKAG